MNGGTTGTGDGLKGAQSANVEGSASPDVILSAALCEFTHAEIRAALLQLDRLSHRDGNTWHRDAAPVVYPVTDPNRNRRLAVAASALAHTELPR